MTRPSSLSSDGLALIKHYEGYAEKPYCCQAGKRTIGYGHVIMPHEKPWMDALTESQATQILRNDVHIAERAIKTLVPDTVPLTQHQFDALVSFIFNLGAEQLRRSTLLLFIKQQRFEEAAGEFEKWILAAGEPSKGLLNRRKSERDLFLGRGLKYYN